MGGEEWEGGGKEGVRPHPKGHPFYLISAGERNHGSSPTDGDFFEALQMPRPVGGVIHGLCACRYDRYNFVHIIYVLIHLQPIVKLVIDIYCLVSPTD